MQSNANRSISIILAVLCFLTYGSFFQSSGSNENSRWNLTRAIVARGELSFAPRWLNTEDRIEIAGKAYSDKAPGLALAGVVPWASAVLILQQTSLSIPAKLYALCYASMLGTVGLASAALVAVWFLVLCAHSGKPAVALLLSVGYGLGTIALPYGTLYMSHQFAAALLGLGFSVLFFQKQGTLPLRPVWAVLAGVLFGFAVTTEYPSVLALAVCGLYAVSVYRKLGLIVAFVAGVFFGILPLLLYNYAVFGSPRTLSYAAYANNPSALFQDYHAGLMGFHLPRLSVLWEITFGFQRGLFWTSPWLLLLVPALLLPVRDSRFRTELSVCRAIVVLYLLMNASFGDSLLAWGGGAAFGPRHIVAALPFAVLAIGLLWSGSRPVGRIAAYWVAAAVPTSVLINLIVTLIEPRTPMPIKNPLWEAYLPKFLDGWWNRGHAGPFTPRDPIFGTSFRTHLGEVLGFAPEFTFAPIVLLWVIFGIVLIRRVWPEISLRDSSVRLGVCTSLAAISFLLLAPTIAARL